MPGKPLVPSRDALRALRHLAYSPPAALIGTAGALCGVATVHYYERRNVRRVEEVLKTKRKLHSISKGKGSARLALMFEAAENGEDFTIGGNNRSRSDRRRNHSMLATQHRSEYGRHDNSPTSTWTNESTSRPNQNNLVNTEKSTTIWKPYSQTDDSFSNIILPRRTRSEKSAQVSAEASTDASSDVWPADLQKADSRVTKQFMGSVVHTLRQALDPDEPANKERSFLSGSLFSRESQEFDMYRVALKRNRFQGSLPWNKEYCFRYVNLQQPAETVDSLSKQSDENLHIARKETVAEQPVSDLNALGQSSGTENGEASSVHQSPNGEGDSIFLNIDAANMFPKNSLSSLRPWQADTNEEFHNTKSLTERTIHRMDTTSLTHAEDTQLDDLYVDKFAIPPLYKKEYKGWSRYKFHRPEVRQAMARVGIQRYLYVFASITNLWQRDEKLKALKLLEKTLHRYTATGISADFALAQALYLDAALLFSTLELKSIMFPYVEKFLSGEQPRLEVVSFLYRSCGATHRTQRQHYYFIAHQYLQEFAEKRHNADELLFELRKVLAGTSLLEIAPHEHLMLPILRVYCSTGKMKLARDLIDEMISVYKIEPTFYTLQTLVGGYSTLGDWSKVKAILDQCHFSELSYKRPYGMSYLLITAIQDYSRMLPPGKVIEFLMHSIREYKVMPISGMTREVIKLCLFHRRYDLVVQWLNMVRKDFPRVDTGTSTHGFAFDVGNVWATTDASCKDIRDACRAFATTVLRDPFSKAFRAAITEAATRHLTPRLQELRNELGLGVSKEPSADIAEFHQTLGELRERAATMKLGARPSLLMSELISQAHALRALNALSRGHLESVGVPSRSLRLHDVAWSPEDTNGDRLPSSAAIIETLVRRYEGRAKNGLPIEHENLRETAIKLIREDREAHAFNVIEHIYNSRWGQPPTGREFDIRIFTLWMKLAWKLASGTRLRTVLWALVDASPELQLTTNIILLARIAAPKTHVQAKKQAKAAELEEVEYLRMRLRRRHWLDSPDHKMQMEEWQGLSDSGALTNFVDDDDYLYE